MEQLLLLFPALEIDYGEWELSVRELWKVRAGSWDICNFCRCRHSQLQSFTTLSSSSRPAISELNTPIYDMESSELMYCVFGNLVLPPPVSFTASELSNLAIIQLVSISAVLDGIFSTALECLLQVFTISLSHLRQLSSVHSMLWREAVISRCYRVKSASDCSLEAWCVLPHGPKNPPNFWHLLRVWIFRKEGFVLPQASKTSVGACPTL
jgi:hypothetical protein